MSDNGADNAKARLALLSLAWGLTGIVHHLTFERLGFGSVPGALYLGATLALVARPDSLPRLGLFLLATVVAMGRVYEHLSNHLVFEFWLAVSLLAGAAARGCVGRRSAFFPASLHAALAPLIRGAWLMLYGFAFWAKLNTGFLSPDASCAALFVEKMFTDHGLGGLPGVAALLETQFLQGVAIWLTLGLELVIPLLLLLRRTRDLGVAVALCFHVLMGLVPILGISSFSSLAFVCLLPWMSDRAFDRLHARLAPLMIWLSRRDLRTRLLKIAGAMAIVAAIALEYRYIHPAPYFVTALWLLVSARPVWLAVRAAMEGWRESRLICPADRTGWFVPRPRLLIVTLAPIALLGVSPYLGFGTQGTFTMFSNLRLHGESPNHLLANPGWFVTRPEVVRVLGTNHPSFVSYRDGSLLLTDHEFRRRAAAITTDFFVIGIHRGERFIVGRRHGAVDTHPLLQTPSWAERTLLRHRDIPTSEPCECQW